MAEWILDDKNAESLLDINGVGIKTIDYMKLLSGQQAIPIDRHMFQFLEIAGVLTADYMEASKIMRNSPELFFTIPCLMTVVDAYFEQEKREL